MITRPSGSTWVRSLKLFLRTSPEIGHVWEGLRLRGSTRMTGNASRRDRRGLASLPSAMLISVCASAKRPLRCAFARARPGTGNAEVRLGRGLKRKRRTLTRKVMR